jgi:hypothetical protein
MLSKPSFHQRFQTSPAGPMLSKQTRLLLNFPNRISQKKLRFFITFPRESRSSPVRPGPDLGRRNSSAATVSSCIIKPFSVIHHETHFEPSSFSRIANYIAIYSEM